MSGAVAMDVLPQPGAADPGAAAGANAPAPKPRRCPCSTDPLTIFLGVVCFAASGVGTAAAIGAAVASAPGWVIATAAVAAGGAALGGYGTMSYGPQQSLEKTAAQYQALLAKTQAEVEDQKKLVAGEQQLSAQLRQKVTDLQGLPAQMEAQQKAFAEERAKMEADMKTKEEQITALNVGTTDLNARIGQLSQQYDQLTASITKVSTTLTSSTAAASAQVTDLSRVEQLLQGHIQEMQKVNDAKAAAKNEAQQKVIELVQSLLTLIGQSNKTTGALQADADTLSKQVKALESSIASQPNLTAQIAQLEADKQALEKLYAERQQELTQLQGLLTDPTIQAVLAKAAAAPATLATAAAADS